MLSEYAINKMLTDWKLWSLAKRRSVPQGGRKKSEVRASLGRGEKAEGITSHHHSHDFA